MALSAFAGSFAKNAGTGAQAVTGVGFLPKVLLFWTSYKSTTDVLGQSYSYAHGMTTGAAESYSASFSSEGGVGTSNNSNRGAAKALEDYGIIECSVLMDPNWQIVTRDYISDGIALQATSHTFEAFDEAANVVDVGA